MRTGRGEHRVFFREHAREDDFSARLAVAARDADDYRMSGGELFGGVLYVLCVARYFVYLNYEVGKTDNRSDEQREHRESDIFEVRKERIAPEIIGKVEQRYGKICKYCIDQPHGSHQPHEAGRERCGAAQRQLCIRIDIQHEEYGKRGETDD